MATTMAAEQLVGLIRTHGLRRMAEAIAEANKGFVAGLIEGWDLTCWRAQQTGGAVHLFRVNNPTEQIITGDTHILAVNGPESERGRWETLARESDPEWPCLVVMVEP